jgi:hypothetical protein
LYPLRYNCSMKKLLTFFGTPDSITISTRSVTGPCSDPDE